MEEAVELPVFPASPERAVVVVDEVEGLLPDVVVVDVAGTVDEVVVVVVDEVLVVVELLL